MVSYIKKRLISIAEVLHLRIFGHEMSEEMRKFIGNLSWSFFGIFFSSAFLFFGSVLIGRFLGPTEYGKYNLVLTISNIAVVIMFFGFDTTAVKFISESSEKEKQNQFMSNSLWAIMVLCPIIVALAFIFRNLISKITNTDDNLILIAFLFAFIVAFKTLFDSFIKAFHKFRYQAFVKIVESSIFFSLVLYFFIFNNGHSYFYFLIPSIVASLAVIFLYGKIIKNKLRKWNNESFLYSKAYLKLTLAVSFIGIFIGTADRLFIAKYLGIRELGIYSAYLMSSTIIIGQLVLALSNVFFPMMNKAENKREIISKVDKLMLAAFIPLVISISLLSFILLKFFGSQYGVNWIYIVFVSVISFLQIITSFYGAITSSSVVLFKLTSRVYYFKPIFIATLYLLAYSFSNFGLISIFFIMMCSYVYDILNTKLAFKLIAVKQ